MISLVLLTGCSKSSQASDAKTESDQSSTQATATAPTKAAVTVIAPEDNPALKGTPVLGFKLGDSTVESVKARLRNYTVSEGQSYGYMFCN